MPSNLRRWHRFEYSGRQFRILIERDETSGIVFRVLKIDEAVGEDEVRLVALPEIAHRSEAEALSDAQGLVVKLTGGSR